MQTGNEPSRIKSTDKQSKEELKPLEKLTKPSKQDLFKLINSSMCDFGFDKIVHIKVGNQTSKDCQDFIVSAQALSLCSSFTAMCDVDSWDSNKEHIIKLEQFQPNHFFEFLKFLHYQMFTSNSAFECSVKISEDFVLNTLPIAEFLDADCVLQPLKEYIESNPTLKLLVAHDQIAPSAPKWPKTVYDKVASEIKNVQNPVMHKISSPDQFHDHPRDHGRWVLSEQTIKEKKKYDLKKQKDKALYEKNAKVEQEKQIELLNLLTSQTLLGILQQTNVFKTIT